jgi:hypothetical protein
MPADFGQLQQPVMGSHPGHSLRLARRQLRRFVLPFRDAWRFACAHMRLAQLSDEGPATGPMTRDQREHYVNGDA